MLIRSLTLATLLAIAGPLFAADGDSPLDMDKGRARPLIVITSSTVDPVWVNLKKSLEDPANKQGVAVTELVVVLVEFCYFGRANKCEVFRPPEHHHPLVVVAPHH